MFLKCHSRVKDGKEHRYWNIVENRRCGLGKFVQRQVLYLGEINDTQRESCSWKVPGVELLASGCNLDRKNPHAKEDITHLPPQQLTTNILDKEQHIVEIVGRIQNLNSDGSL